MSIRRISIQLLPPLLNGYFDPINRRWVIVMDESSTEVQLQEVGSDGPSEWVSREDFESQYESCTGGYFLRSSDNPTNPVVAYTCLRTKGLITPLGIHLDPEEWS